MSSNNESGCVKMIGVLAGIATIIGVIIAFFAWVMPFSPTGSSPLASQATEQLANTEIYPLATDTFLPPPTDIPLSTPLPTQFPTEMPPSDTPPNTILEFGETWRQAGLELTMTKSEWGWGEGWVDEGGGVYSFMLTNLESYDRSFRLSSDNFSATDNLGNSVPMIPKANTTIDEYCPSQTIQLHANQTIDLAYQLLCAQFMSFALTPRIDAGNTSITEIIVSVSVSNITNARWRTRIYH